MTQETDREQDAELEEQAEETPAAELTPEERIDALSQECEELRTKWLRAQADYQNLRRRSHTDFETGLKRSLQPLLEELLLVLDFLDMALASPATTDEAKNLALGVEMTRTKFTQALESSEVQAIDTSGTFDPALHEATGTRPEDGAEPGTIVETVRRGYTWRGNVLRHAHVIVAAGDEEDSSGETPSSAEEEGTDES